MTVSGLIPRSGSNSNIASLSAQNGLRSQPIPSVGCKKRGSPTTETNHLARFHRTITGRRVGMLLAAFVSLFSFLMLISFASQISVHFIAPAGLDVIHTWRIEVDKETGLKEVTKGTIVGLEEISLKGTEADKRGGKKETVSGLVDICKVLDDVKSGLNKKSVTRWEGEKESIQTGVESEAKSIYTATMAAGSLSEGLPLRAAVVPRMSPTDFENHNSLPRSLLTSDQPLPPGHPCHGFTLPPPPADKKRTGPRPCPVCYLPVEEAIDHMPPASTLTTSSVKTLTYIVESLNNITQQDLPGSEFGGHPSLEERHSSYQIRDHMNVHCGFVRGPKPGLKTGFEIDEEDLANLEKCMGIVVASAIFGNYDLLQQPKNISSYSRKNVCFFMFVDEETHRGLNNVISDSKSSENQIWRIVVVRNMPYADARRNGKIPKLLLHRLFPNARFSLWIDGKLQLVVDPYQVLERFLWRQNLTFAISQHYKRLDVFEEAEANKAAGKYDNTSIDAQISFYKKEGIRHYSPKSPFRSDVPEGCVIIREHTPISNLFTCLWFNEVDRFTSRDQLSFAIVRNKLLEKVPWRFNMFLDCERRNFVVQNYHKDILEQRKSLQRGFYQQIVETNKGVSMHVDAPGTARAALQESRRPHSGAALQESSRLSSSRRSQRHKRGAKA